MPARASSGEREVCLQMTVVGSRFLHGSRFPAFICKRTPSGVDPAVSRNDQHRFQSLTHTRTPTNDPSSANRHIRGQYVSVSQYATCVMLD